MDIYRAVMMDYLRVDVGWKMNWVVEVEPSKNHTLIRKKSYFNKYL